MDDSRYYDLLMVAYVRGRMPELARASDAEAIRAGRDAGLRLHRFKRTSGLPRVSKVLGILRGLAPEDLLDIGSGRGAFLWPLLDSYPGLPVTVAEVDPIRVRDLRAVADGGIHRLNALQADVTDLPLDDGAVDVATALEVLEHLQQPQRAARELIRVARRFVVASVPSKPDDNPQHIQLFDHQSFHSLFMDAGAAKVHVEYVLNHRIAVVSLP